MSTKLGTLTLDLVTRTAGFTAPIKTAEKQTVTSFDAMKKSVLTYGAIAVSGAAAVGAGVLAMATEYANAARELQTFASISNTTTQEFQKMAVGAETMGISSEKLSDQLKDFNEKLGEFITIGSGGAVDFFEQIAIKTEGSAEAARKLALEMQNLSGPKALQLYVDKLEEAGVTQQQMSFYLESMASDTTNLIPLLKNGGEGFKFWADAAERAGVIMDESAIKKANELSVQMKLLDLQVKGAKNQFIQGLMPALVSVGDSLTDATTETNLMSDAGATLGNVFMGVAAMGMGVYAVIKMLSNAIAGLAVDAVNAKKMVDKTSENGTWADKLPGIKLGKALILGTANARFNENSGVQMAMQDNAKVAEDIGNTITDIFSKTTSEAVEAMAEIQNNQQGVISGSEDWIKKQNEAAKATKKTTDTLKEQQAQARKKISYDYMDDFAKFAEDYKRQVTEIQEANFGPQESQYLAKAKARYEYEEEMYLRQITEEINTFKWSEEQKLDYFYETQRIIVSESGKYNDELKQLKLKALDEQYAIELQKARFHAQNVQQTMRDSIKGLSYGVDEIFAQATMSPQDYDRWSLANDRSNAQLGLKNERVRVEQDIMTSDAYSTDDERYAALLEAHQEYRDAMAAIDVDYQQKTKDLEFQQYNEKMGMYSEMLSQASSIWGNMTQLVKDSQGEQSGAFKAMFLIQQSMAAAQAIIYANVASAAALAPPPIGLGPVAGAPLSSLIKINGYMSAGIIAGQTIAGMAHDGIDNIPKEGTWLLDKGERVVDSRTNADLKNMIASNNGGGPQININVPPGYTAEQSRGADGAVTIDIVEKRIKQSWSNLGNPNSYESKQVQRNTTAGVKR